ncbi:MAG: phosphohydrolase [Treponema sp.]|nr:phosphohydrolase [Treponema sp.]
MKSSKELSIDITLIDFIESLNLSAFIMQALKLMLASEEIQATQEYGNTVSIIRLGFNDHGPVHMRKVTNNAALMLDLLRKAGIKTSLETDGCGTFEDSLLGVMMAAMLHDIGMIMGRQNHESNSALLAYPIITGILNQVFNDDIKKIVMIRGIALEGIAGHMGTLTVSSLEAGIVQVADGCDMTKGRARIPIALSHSGKMGQIHQYSANSIEEVLISAGSEKPIRINVNMSSEVGLFQVEEVLMHKISLSPAKKHIELYAKVCDKEEKRYL